MTPKMSKQGLAEPYFNCLLPRSSQIQNAIIHECGFSVLFRYTVGAVNDDEPFLTFEHRHLVPVSLNTLSCLYGTYENLRLKMLS